MLYKKKTLNRYHQKIISTARAIFGVFPFPNHVLSCSFVPRPASEFNVRLHKDNTRMKFISIAYILLLLVPTALISTASANNFEKWFLISRHGECSEIRSLQRKIPDIGTIEAPQSFIMFMEGKGHKVIVKDLYSSEWKELQGKALQVSIPEKGLSLLFVKGSMCKEFIDR